MTSRIRLLGTVAAATLAFASVGCEATTNRTSVARPGGNPSGLQATGDSPLSNTDPCAMRLHDVCGALLLYYFTHNELPEKLSDLNAIPGEAPVELTCPVTKTPYIYTPNGIQIPERKSFIIIYDPSPAHAGMRWAVSIEQPVPGQPLVTKVVPLAERFFLLRPPVR
ncbi:MAG: hypothetical protein QM770_16025 [Tepidisphaeraceae bacterium]